MPSSTLAHPNGKRRDRTCSTSPADNVLMRRIQNGSHDAFGTLYERYCERAYRVARSVSYDHAYAEDAVQEGFAAIWKARASYRPDRPSAAAWVLTLVRHRAIDIKRRNATQHSHQVGDDALENHGAADDVAATAAMRLEAGELRARINRLPDAQREVVVLAFYGQLTHTEIADRLGLPVGTVKGRMRLGLRKLRDDLAAARPTRAWCPDDRRTRPGR